ncbi:hypothetical protein PINS_up013783 [Pythium insidiosum]|nr:hypothetical protein PINS_up013783 [Pythium insidiosum]
MAELGLDALAALETRAIREKERTTYNSTLGAVSFFLVAALGLSLPSPWRVLNGDWSSSLLLSLTALAGTAPSMLHRLSVVYIDVFLCLLAHAVLVVSVVVAFRCAQVQGAELYDQFLDRVCNGTRSSSCFVGGHATRINVRFLRL